MGTNLFNINEFSELQRLVLFFLHFLHTLQASRHTDFMTNEDIWQGFSGRSLNTNSQHKVKTCPERSTRVLISQGNAALICLAVTGFIFLPTMPKPFITSRALFALELFSNAVVSNHSQHERVAAMELQYRNTLILCIEDSVLARKKRRAYTLFVKLKLTKGKKSLMPGEWEY